MTELALLLAGWIPHHYKMENFAFCFGFFFFFVKCVLGVLNFSAFG
jgi:hypothetical protein